MLREEQKAATRHRVLDAAVAVFTAAPFVTASVGDVAEAAGVTRMTVYAHFPDGKADLVRGLIDRVYATADRLYAGLAAVAWTRPAIRDWLTVAAAAWRDMAPTIRVVTTTGAIARPPGERGQYVDAHERYVALLASGSRWDGVPESHARQRVLMAVLQIESVLTVWAVGVWPDGEPIDLLADAVCHLLAPALTDGGNRG